MLLVLIIYHLVSQAVQALPLATIAETSSPTSDAVRTKSNIVWSCLVTIFSCTWVAIHPNIPEPGMGGVMSFLYRARLMMLALIAPELVITWAICQWLNAGRLGKEHKNTGWTQTHGFFAIMGGFMLYDGDKPQHVISPDDVESYLKNGEIRITEKEIKDRSKGDSLSKGLVIIQTSWFILQCIARRVERLPITELELVTLAFAALNFATYALWWNKPLNVECAVRVYRKHQEGGVKEGQGGQATDGLDTEIEERNNTVTATHRALAVGVGHRVWNAIKELLVAIGFADKAWVVVLAALLSPVWVPLYALVLVMWLLGRLASDDEIEDGAKWVPTFYSGTTTDADDVTALFAGIVIATVFGGIHCVAWSFQFPSHTEQLIWRISSLTITCVPPLELVGFVILTGNLHSIRKNQNFLF